MWFVSACKYDEKAASLLKGAKKASSFIRHWSEAWSIYWDYQRLADTRWLMQTAFKSPWMYSFIESIKKQWTAQNAIWQMVVWDSKWNIDKAKKIQAALNLYIAQSPTVSLLSAGRNMWDWQKRDTELTSDEKVFVQNLYNALNDFTIWIDKSNFRNIKTFVIWAINDWILWQNLSSQWWNTWKWLWNLIWMVSSTWEWNNNILWFLWHYDWNKDAKYWLIDGNWEIEYHSISDLYSDDDVVMQRTWNLLFSSDLSNPEWFIEVDPTMYRKAIKTLMKATDKDSQQWFLTNITNKLMKRWAIWKLTSYWLNFAAWTMMWVNCLYTWYLNIMSYNRKHSDALIDPILKNLGMSTSFFDFKSMKNRSLESLLKSYFWDTTKDLDLEDMSRDDKSFWDNAYASWWLMWPANVFWDTVFRWEYLRTAMDFALQKCWWDDTSHLYKMKDWQMVPDPIAFARLMMAFKEQLAHIAWFNEIEWWSQSLFQFDTKWNWTVMTWLKTWMNIALKWMHFMTSWATPYINWIYKNVLWWLVWAYMDIMVQSWKKTKAEIINEWYKWIWWQWLIKRFTRRLDTENVSMPRECGRELVSKEEFANELMRFVAWLRNMYRLWNMWCRDEETWELDWWCAWNNFLTVAYLPGQAAMMAHPIIRSIFDTAVDCYKYWNYFSDKPNLWVSDWDVFKESLYTNVFKPILRSLYILKVWAWAYEETYQNEYNEDTFLMNLREQLVNSSDWFMYYVSDELSSYVYWDTAYWPKTYLNNDTAVFWTPLKEREALDKYWRIKWIESIANNWLFEKLINSYSFFRVFKNAMSWEDSSWLYESDIVNKFLSDFNEDKDVFEMMNWRFTQEMRRDSDFMQYVWTNLTSDWQSYWANYKDWVRDNKYNKAEISYFETLLKKDMDEITKAQPWLSDLQIYDKALQKFFAWTPTYDQIKQAIQLYDNAWESEYWAYTDYLASAAWREETTWVKWLALIAEYRKRELMEQMWLKYSSSATAEEKWALKLIENQVASELWPYLWLADRRQYSNLVWRWFMQNHDEYKDLNIFSNLVKDWEWNLNWDVKTTWTLWTALWANNLARTELILWNTNWYELANVFTEKFWSCMDENWNFDKTKALQLIDWITLLDQVMEDAGKTQLERSLIWTPTLTKNLELFTFLLDSDNKEAEILREQMWTEIFNNIRWFLYDTYSDINALPELLETLNDEKVIETILWKNSWYKRWWSGKSLYYWKTSAKDYDYYRDPSKALNARWSKNLSKFVNSYGSTWKSSYAWNYSSREFKFLNQRAYRNPINSTRIAPDIPLTVWWFSRPTVKSKNPVSWFTTNIKPWEKGSGAKFGKGKGIVWWATTRWPVTNFKA